MAQPPLCILSVPANRAAFFGKAAATRADTLMLDLEDAVFPDQKVQARLDAAIALGDRDWGRKRMLARVNGLDTKWGLADLAHLAAAAPRLDGFMVPKVQTVADIAALDRIVGCLDRDRPDRPLEVHILIETALGVANVEAILAASRRLGSVTFGAGDYAWSVADWSGLGGGTDETPLLLWAKARVANACHAYGVPPIDGPSRHVADLQACKQAARASRALGFTGKWSIHPSQVPIVRQSFAPSPEAVAWAEQALPLLEAAQHAGTGAAQLNGRLVEAAHRPVAQRIIAEVARMKED